MTMTTRRNFSPQKPDADYEHRHIRFVATVEVNLHNVGGAFEMADAVAWLNEALERGLKLTDPNDKAVVTPCSERLVDRPECKCYPKE